MELTITARRAHVSDMMKEIISRKVEHLVDHAEAIGSVRVFVDAAGNGFRVGLMSHTPGRELYAQATADNIGKALDTVVARATRQLDKTTSRRTDHWAGARWKQTMLEAA